jgi:hypothetical protein
VSGCAGLGAAPGEVEEMTETNKGHENSLLLPLLLSVMWSGAVHVAATAYLAADFVCLEPTHATHSQ